MRGVIKNKLHSGLSNLPAEEVPMAAEGLRIFELSAQEADGLHHDYIGTEHLLLGLLSSREGITGEALKDLHVQPEDARREVLNMVGV
jgi:ATP-dependent Clp protease ATP-binding subunit ClpC